MSTLEQDLAHLNFEYLMLARECARSNSLEAAWRFGVDHNQIEAIATYSIEKIKDLSGNSRAVVTLLPLHTPDKISLAIHSSLLTPVITNAEDA